MTVDVKQPECGPKRGSPSLPRNACHRKFYNETCLQLHVTQGVCQTLKRCPECCKQFDPRDERTSPMPLRQVPYLQENCPSFRPSAVFSRSAGGRRFRRLLVYQAPATVYQAPATHVKQKQRKIIL